jgi:hypothetical protein
MTSEYEEARFRLYRELFENLPPELSQELEQQMVGVRKRRTAESGESLLTESNIESMLRSNIVNGEVNRRLPPPPNLDWLAHNRVADLLSKKGARILNIGNRGYPDLLFELGGEVFAAEVKGVGDFLRPHQEVVISALKRLKRVFLVRESGQKAHANDLTVEELLSELFK